jgi:hypothetical protein
LEDHAVSIIRVVEAVGVRSLELLHSLVTIGTVINKHSSFFIGANEILSTIPTLCTKALKCSLTLTLSNPIFLPTAYSPALICFGWERGWWITCNYPTVLKEKQKEKQKEYNLRYLLAKAQVPTAGEQTQQKPCWTSSDIGAKQENHTVGRGPT